MKVLLGKLQENLFNSGCGNIFEMENKIDFLHYLTLRQSGNNSIGVLLHETYDLTHLVVQQYGVRTLTNILPKQLVLQEKENLQTAVLILSSSYL